VSRRLFALSLIVGLVLPACGGDKPKLSSAPTTEASAAAGGELVFFNPTHVPAGMKLDEATVQRGTPEEPTWGAKLGRPNGAGKFRDVITVVVSQPATPREVGEAEEKAARKVDVNGHTALLLDETLIGSAVSWNQDGYEIAVLGPTGKSEDALAVARHTRLASAGHAEQTTLDGLPTGMEVIAQGALVGVTRNRYSISAASDAGGSLNLDVTLVPKGFPAAVAAAGHESDATRKVRGHDAILFRQTTDIGGTTLEQVSLVWSERPDLIVSISGTMSADEAFAVAAGLKAESEQVWRSHLKVLDDS
jgi:hypothetical protein